MRNFGTRGPVNLQENYIVSRTEETADFSNRVEENVNGFLNYLTPAGQIEMEPLLDNFQDFIACAGFRILQVPETPQEYVGRHLLLTYLD